WAPPRPDDAPPSSGRPAQRALAPATGTPRTIAGAQARVDEACRANSARVGIGPGASLPDEPTLAHRFEERTHDLAGEAQRLLPRFCSIVSTVSSSVHPSGLTSPSDARSPRSRSDMR